MTSSHEPRFLADEDFDRDILIGVLRIVPTLDVVRAQEVGLTSQDDPLILEWAAEHGRILLSRDTGTMIEAMPKPGFALDRRCRG